MAERLTQFDRTFRHAEDWLQRDEAWVKEQFALGDPSIGSVAVRFAARVTEAMRKTGKLPAPAVQMATENRQHWISACAFAEHMSRQAEPRHWTALTPAFDDFVHKLSSYVYFGASEALNTAFCMYYQQAGLKLAGKPVYEVSQGLALELLDTELRGLTADDLRLPFETVYIHAPADLGLEVYNSDSGWHDLDGIYISEDYDDEDGATTWRFLLVGVPKPIQDTNGLSLDNDALLHWRFRFAHSSLEECIAHTEQEMIEQTESEAFKEIIPRWRQLFRFAMNTILYATMPDADVERVVTNEAARRLFARVAKLPKGKKRERLKARLKGMNTESRYVLGRSVKVDRTVAEARRSGGKGGRTLNVQHRRTGHYRDQPYGEGRKLIKRIWIKPCWVGGKDKPLSIKTYKLDKHDGI